MNASDLQKLCEERIQAHLDAGGKMKRRWWGRLDFHPKDDNVTLVGNCGCALSIAAQGPRKFWCWLPAMVDQDIVSLQLDLTSYQTCAFVDGFDLDKKWTRRPIPGYEDYFFAGKAIWEKFKDHPNVSDF